MTQGSSRLLESILMLGCDSKLGDDANYHGGLHNTSAYWSVRPGMTEEMISCGICATLTWTLGRR